MDLPSRRRFLATSLALAAGSFLPIEMTRGGAGVEELEARALAIARTAEQTGPAAALAAARSLHNFIQLAISATRQEPRRRVLLRASSVSAVAAARASRWSGLPWNGWLTIAETAAKEAGDGPLQAQAWLERATAEGAAARSAEYPHPARLTLAAAALDRVGIGDNQAGHRAAARWKAAWELAVAGSHRGALSELEPAVADAELAGWSQPAIDEMVGGIMRKLGRLVDAELALSGALDSPPVRRILVLSDLAHTYVLEREVDAAGEALEEAFLLTRAHNVEGRLQRVKAVRALLPSGRTAQELDEVMRGA